MKKQIILTLFLVFLMYGLFAASGEKALVLAKIYRILPIQAEVLASSDERGRTTSKMSGAQVTFSFPKGIVLLDGGIINDLPDEQIRETIKNKISWRGAEYLKEGISIDYIGQNEFAISGEHTFDRKIGYRIGSNDAIISGPSDSYRLRIISEKIYNNKLIIHVQFWSSSKEDENYQEERFLLDMALQLDCSRILLVGFRDEDPGPRKGVVYWLALLAK
jgi:hypothetical protein